MKTLNLFFLIAFIVFAHPAFAQIQSIESSTFNLSSMPYAYSANLKVGPSFGLNYVRNSKRQFALVIGGTYLKTIFDDSRKTCFDCMSGFLLSRQITAFIGGRYLLRKKIDKPFNYFAELDATYFNVLAKGDYQGGIGGQGSYTNLSSQGFGGDLKLGVIYNISKRFYLSFNTQFFIGQATVKHYSRFDNDNILREINDLYWKEGLEFRIGYRF